MRAMVLKAVAVTALVFATTPVLANDIIVQGNNLADRFAWLQAFAQSNGNYIIEMRSDESVSSQKLVYSGQNNITITIKGIGSKRTVSPVSKGTMFSIGSGVSLVLYNITLQDGHFYIHDDSFYGNKSDNPRPVVVVESGGSLVMNKGSAIIGAKGVSVGGIFTMNDGTVSGSHKGGVSVYAGGTFDMQGGSISGNNYAGVVMGGGIFIMNNGAISANRGHGVIVGGSTNTGGFGNQSVGGFTMSGGTISGNSGDGVYVNSQNNIGAALKGAFTMSGGTISDNGNSGVNVIRGQYSGQATFIMNSGTISGNKNGGVRGAGIFNLNNGTISGNIGSGVNVATFTMNGGIIIGNTAKENGGGVNVVGTFIMTGGTITGNTAGGYGGGVYISVTNNSAFTKTGGTISGYNSDKNNGNAVIEVSGNKKNYRGHAVYASGTNSHPVKIKETTAGTEDNLFYNTDISDGAWDNSVAQTWKAGANVTATLGGGPLIVKGTGPMTNWIYAERDYDSGNPPPWGSRRSIINVVIENGVTSIGDYAFYGCTRLASITIGDSVTSIGKSAFSGCTGLRFIAIGDGVISIGTSAFGGCTGLTSVIIGDGVTSIGDSAFSGCVGLKSIIFGNSVTSIGDGAFRSNKLTSVTISNHVTTIGGKAFFDNQLTNVTIPNGVTYIGDSAFSNNQLSSITIGANVTLGQYVFGDGFEEYYQNNDSISDTYYRYSTNNSDGWVSQRVEDRRQNLQELERQRRQREEVEWAEYERVKQEQQELERQKQEEEVRQQRQREELKRAEHARAKLEAERTAWRMSGTGPSILSLGIPFLSNIDPIHQGVGLVWSPIFEFFKADFSFLRAGLDLELSWMAFGVDKNEIEEIHAISLNNDAIKSLGAGVVKAGTFVSLFPVDFVYLSGGVGFGGYQKYWAKTENGNSLSPSPGWIYAPVFSVGGGIIIPVFPNSGGILIAVKYNTLPINDRTAEYWSVNLGLHMGKGKSLKPSESSGTSRNRRN